MLYFYNVLARHILYEFIEIVGSVLFPPERFTTQKSLNVNKFKYGKKNFKIKLSVLFLRYKYVNVIKELLHYNVYSKCVGIQTKDLLFSMSLDLINACTTRHITLILNL